MGVPTADVGVRAAAWPAAESGGEEGRTAEMRGLLLAAPPLPAARPRARAGEDDDAGTGPAAWRAGDCCGADGDEVATAPRARGAGLLEKRTGDERRGEDMVKWTQHRTS
jgi:hypothetical protein